MYTANNHSKLIFYITLLQTQEEKADIYFTTGIVSIPSPFLNLIDDGAGAAPRPISFHIEFGIAGAIPNHPAVILI